VDAPDRKNETGLKKRGETKKAFLPNAGSATGKILFRNTVERGWGKLNETET
jgi:hypothetical protein